MKKKVKIILLILITILIVLMAFRVVKKKKQELARLNPPRRAPLPVEVVPVRWGILEVREHYLGELTPVLSAKIASRLSGYLLSLNKFEGDSVKAGEVLARIDARDLVAKKQALSAEIEAARVEYLVKKRIFERDKVLFENKALSKEAFELSKAALRAAEARLKGLEADLISVENALSYAVIKAPFSGVVTKRFKNPGDLILPGIPILEIEAPQEGFRFLVRIPQRKAREIVPQARAYLKLGEKQIEARVFRVHPAVGPGELATVEIRLAQRPFGLPTGARIGVDLVMKRVEGFLLPLRGVLKTTQKAYVFCALPEEAGLSRIRILPVKLLGRSGEKAACQGEIPEGCLAVVAEEGTLLSLKEGQIVRALRLGPKSSRGI